MFTRAICLIISVFASLEASAATCGQLAGVKGTGVEVLRMQSGRTEKVRYALRVEENKVMPLECDDIVLAGRDSSARIILANGKLSLGPESRIEIAAHSGGAGGTASTKPKVNLINLTYGKMRALIQEKPSSNDKGKEPQANFRVRTFSAVVGVRGTDFYTSYDPNAGITEQATIEGAVEVQQAGTPQKVLVEAGKQVTVETTAAAIAANEERVKTGNDVALEPPKQAPEVASQVKPLVVVPIQETLRQEIRVVSAVARDDKDFAHSKAVEALGQPDTWTLEREKVPEKLKELKNEF